MRQVAMDLRSIGFSASHAPNLHLMQPNDDFALMLGQGDWNVFTS